MRAAAEMCGRTVVLENLVHQALICEPSGGTVEEALTGWEQRSRATGAGDHPATCGPAGWLTAPVEYQGERWGRVVMLPARADGPAFGPEDVTVLERTAMALTVARLIAHRTPRGSHGTRCAASPLTWNEPRPRQRSSHHRRTRQPDDRVRLDDCAARRQ